MRARHLQDAGPGKQRPEALAGGSGRQVGGNQIGHEANSAIAQQRISRRRVERTGAMVTNSQPVHAMYPSARETPPAISTNHWPTKRSHITRTDRHAAAPVCSQAEVY